MEKCRNCGHKIMPPPPMYVGKEKYFHGDNRNFAPYCLNTKCMCEKPEPKKEVSGNSSQG